MFSSHGVCDDGSGAMVPYGRYTHTVARVSGHADTCYRGTASVWAAAMGGEDAGHADACLANPVAVIVGPHVTRAQIQSRAVAARNVYHALLVKGREGAGVARRLLPPGTSLLSHLDTPEAAAQRTARVEQLIAQARAGRRIRMHGPGPFERASHVDALVQFVRDRCAGAPAPPAHEPACRPDNDVRRRPLGPNPDALSDTAGSSPRDAAPRASPLSPEPTSSHTDPTTRHAPRSAHSPPPHQPGATVPDARALRHSARTAQLSR